MMVVDVLGDLGVSGENSYGEKAGNEIGYWLRSCNEYEFLVRNNRSIDIRFRASIVRYLI